MTEQDAVGTFRIAQHPKTTYLSYTVDAHSVVSEIWTEMDRDDYEMHDVSLTDDGEIRVDIATPNEGNDAE